MIDFAQVRVAELAPFSPDDLERRVIALSLNRAPVGWGRLCARAADLANVRSDVVTAIAMKETGRFAYGGSDAVFSADPTYHNFGGIKTTDHRATHRFRTDALGVLGLVAHVAWYAHADHVAYFCDKAHDPRHFSGPLWNAWQHKGGLVTVAQLGRGIWNTSPDYSVGVVKILDALWAL